MGDNTKMNLQKVGWDRWRALVNGMINLRVSHNATRCKSPPPPKKKLVFHVVIYVNIAVNVWNYAHVDSLLALWRAFEIVQKKCYEL
jgi:hypothetical protein